MLSKLIQTCVHGVGDSLIGGSTLETRTMLMARRGERCTDRAPWNGDSFDDWEAQVYPDRYEEPDYDYNETHDYDAD